MNSIRERYTELLALVQLYLLQEYSPTDRLIASSNEFKYFKEYALDQQQKGTSLAVAKSTATTTPPTISKPAPPPPQKSEPTPIVLQEKLAVSQQPVANKRPPLPVLEPKDSGVEAKKAPKEKHQFAPEVPKALPPVDLSDVKKIATEQFPGLKFVDAIPNDIEAKKRARAWENQEKAVEVMILSFDEKADHQAFLSNIGKALRVYGLKVRLAHASKVGGSHGWTELFRAESLKLVIGAEAEIINYPELLPHLDKIPSCLLSEINLYFKEPQLKKSLWDTISNSLGLNNRVS